MISSKNILIRFTEKQSNHFLLPMLHLVSDVQLLFSGNHRPKDAVTWWPRSVRLYHYRIKTDQKGMLIIQQTKWLSNFQTPSCMSSKMIERNNSTELNKSTNRYIIQHVTFSTVCILKIKSQHDIEVYCYMWLLVSGRFRWLRKTGWSSSSTFERTPTSNHKPCLSQGNSP